MIEIRPSKSDPEIYEGFIDGTFRFCFKYSNKRNSFRIVLPETMNVCILKPNGTFEDLLGDSVLISPK